jgi:arabinose-5-phosphate isomerase
MFDKKNDEIIGLIKKKIQLEADALNRVAAQMDDSCAEAAKLISDCRGRVVVTGLGKAGHIGKKIAATFASLGIPSFFVHSCEALHGDMGMITKDDVVIMISNSGKSPEMLNMLPPLKIIGPKTISITNNRESPLAKETDIAILCDAGDEIDQNGLAPTASAIAVLAIGDALAAVISQEKGFTRNDFALNHPSGALGQKLVKISGTLPPNLQMGELA